VVSKAVADNPIHQVVVIRSDRSTAVQSVVTIMDLCTKLKVPSYKISTDAPPAS
jgi:biopolymer transport protein ExbD